MAPQQRWRTPGAGYARIVPADDKMAIPTDLMPHGQAIVPGGCGTGHWQTYWQWLQQQLQLKAHGMLMGHNVMMDLCFSRVCPQYTPTCMNSMTLCVAYTSSKHAITVHILSMAPCAQPSTSWRSLCISYQCTSTCVMRAYVIACHQIPLTAVRFPRDSP